MLRFSVLTGKNRSLDNYVLDSSTYLSNQLLLTTNKKISFSQISRVHLVGLQVQFL